MKYLRQLIAALILIPFMYYLVLGQDYKDITRDYRLKFPDDFYYKKDYRIQWWYFTGHLFDETGREFGYELTFFVVGIQKKTYRSRFGLQNIYISHFAISDLAKKSFYYTDKSDSGAFDFAGAREDLLNIWVGKNSVKGTPEKMHLSASDDDKTLDLTLIPTKPVILHGENGYSRKSEESLHIASYYFSYTNLKTEGSLKIGNETFSVRGKSWFDREISSRGFGQNQIQWDWFAIKLDDNREIMLYLLRNKDGSIDKNSSGTLVSNDGKYRHLPKEDFSVTVLSFYKSQETGARYPSQWEIKIPSEKIQLTIVPLLADQELATTYSTLNYYWEGTCAVEGTEKGRAYVEMTGYTR
jgi:predicted secreted hydrolase